jgi:hypothetical protein
VHIYLSAVLILIMYGIKSFGGLINRASDFGLLVFLMRAGS